jgi:catalase (peroxidase I)
MFLFSSVLVGLASSSCPFNQQVGYEQSVDSLRARAPEGYAEALMNIDFNDVKEDLRVFYKQSQDWWPADYGNYGPFFIRLAWHCSGSYRIYDGRGGCDGGRQRFDPERSWDDNTNLDKARSLLWPIKQKYGDGLSWGDLFVLAGTTAIESMGGPVLGFCGGRIDDVSGYESIELGPNREQEAIFPCEVNGQCKPPFGTTTIGLIYVNPEGPMGIPDPDGSRHDVRDTFQRMAMNDSETVALIGGGHAFGKTHGACPTGPGPNPDQDPSNPWPGTCDNGTFTSGFEGPWTQTPTQWDNSYFTLLVNNNWTVHVGPGNHSQWKVDGVQPVAPGPDPTSNKTQNVMMLTSDVSLTYDDAFLEIVERFANNPDELDVAFSHAWYKLTSRDMGPHSRCAGSLVPEPQPWQYPLPEPSPDALTSYSAVKTQESL